MTLSCHSLTISCLLRAFVFASQGHVCLWRLEKKSLFQQMTFNQMFVAFLLLLFICFFLNKLKLKHNLMSRCPFPSLGTTCCCILSHHHRFSVLPGTYTMLNTASRQLLHDGRFSSSVHAECNQLLQGHSSFFFCLFWWVFLFCFKCRHSLSVSHRLINVDIITLKLV